MDDSTRGGGDDERESLGTDSPDSGSDHDPPKSQSTDDGENGQWRFGLDDVDEEGIVKATIEPGEPTLEHVLFVVLGALAMVLVIVRLWLLL